MNAPLTPAQKRVYDTFLQLLTDRQGVPPTVREVALAVGTVSSSTVQVHLMTLIRKGWLMRVDGMGSRGIVPTSPQPEAVA